MACRVADNPPLQNLLSDLGIAPRCHSYRAGCLHKLPAPESDQILGTAGAAIGYCQALFRRAGTAAQNTQRIIRLLKEIDAPWHRSHELFWGHAGDQTPGAFVEDAASPLIGEGRIPILITGLNADRDISILRSISDTRPLVAKNETILLRMVVSNELGIKNVSDLISEFIERAARENIAPAWWPLIQGDMSPVLWKALKVALGDNWKYANVAMNPFFAPDQFEVVREQITVGQIAVGAPDGIYEDGNICLHPDMVPLTGAGRPDASYNINEFTAAMTLLEFAPTLIVLGPSLPDWPDEENQRRLSLLVPHLKNTCDGLWSALKPNARQMVWELAA